MKRIIALALMVLVCGATGVEAQGRKNAPKERPAQTALSPEAQAKMEQRQAELKQRFEKMTPEERFKRLEALQKSLEKAKKTNNTSMANRLQAEIDALNSVK